MKWSSGECVACRRSTVLVCRECRAYVCWSCTLLGTVQFVNQGVAYCSEEHRDAADVRIALEREATGG